LCPTLAKEEAKSGSRMGVLGMSPSAGFGCLAQSRLALLRLGAIFKIWKTLTWLKHTAVANLGQSELADGPLQMSIAFTYRLTRLHRISIETLQVADS
jgi:hypothetical protein